MKNYFNFRVRGLQLFAVCIGYLLCIVAGGYSGMTISMHYTQAAAMAAVDPVTSSAVAREALVELVVFQILYLLAACLLAFFYMRICIEGSNTGAKPSGPITVSAGIWDWSLWERC